MSQITFVGAAGMVTGSKHLVEHRGMRFFVDCGMYQGPREIEQLNHAPLPLLPRDLDAIVITHGHLDHVGYLPKIVHDGFSGPIFCTPATAEVAAIVLEDAANIQEHMRARGFHHERGHAIPPFYDRDDVRKTLRAIETVDLDTDFDVCRATVRYRNAGHIIGSAFVDVRFGSARAVFSGDLGRYDRFLLDDPAPLDTADVVVCESTYGDRLHVADALAGFEHALLEGMNRGGPIVIPAFAVERTQEMLYAIGRLQARNPLIASIPVHLDSPMAAKVDAVFARHPEAHKPLPPGEAFGCKNVGIHVSPAESKELNRLHGPSVIIASGGMATGGRVLFHLHRLVSDPSATIMFVGYQVRGTLGRMLVEGASRIRIFGDALNVRAQIVHLGGYSAHADQAELLRWLSTLQSKPRLYAVHGEPEASAALVALVRERLGFEAEVARRGMTVRV